MPEEQDAVDLLDSLGGGRRWGVGIQEGLGRGRGDEGGIGVVIGVEGAVDGVAAFVQAWFAGDLDGDPPQDHRRNGDHRGRDGSHPQLLFLSALPCDGGLVMRFADGGWQTVYIYRQLVYPCGIQ